MAASRFPPSETIDTTVWQACTHTRAKVSPRGVLGWMGLNMVRQVTKIISVLIFILYFTTAWCCVCSKPMAYRMTYPPPPTPPPRLTTKNNTNCTKTTKLMRTLIVAHHKSSFLHKTTAAAVEHQRGRVSLSSTLGVVVCCLLLVLAVPHELSLGCGGDGNNSCV